MPIIDPLHGSEYEEGSFSDFIHKYINAQDPETLTVLKSELTTPERVNELVAFTEGVIAEFVPHFRERFRSVAVESDAWHLEIDKWNHMGAVLGLIARKNDIPGMYKYAESLYLALYDLINEKEVGSDRIHKGTPLHQVGWVNLLRGDKESLAKSTYFMKLALIEDGISTQTDRYKELPAYKALSGIHGIPAENLCSLVSYARKNKKKYNEWSYRPEVTFLSYVTNRSNQDRSRIEYLDPTLATSIKTRAYNATTAHKKGQYLEMLVAYLFLSSEGFEAQANLAANDGDIDLLVRNTNEKIHELGRYIIIEAKNRKDVVDASMIRSFSSKVIQGGCSCGIIISKNGISSQNADGLKNAKLAILKSQQRSGITIIPLSVEALEAVINKKSSLQEALTYEYERTRFDLK